MDKKPSLRIECSRCHASFHYNPNEKMTAGFYTRSGWEQFFDPGEEYLCDDCMFMDPRYIKVYGKIR
jgi:hypothetical protein